MWIRCCRNLLAASLLASGLARGDDTLSREVLYTGLHLVDWAQTRSIARSPGDWYEKNLVLGRHPSTRKVDGYMAGSLAVHWAVTYALPPRYRPAWQWGTIAVEAWCVGKNARLGVSARF